jgi:hypothetical protein
MTLAQLITIKGCKGKLHEEKDQITGVLTLITDGGEIEMTTDEFHTIYTNMVNLWPTVKPLKEQVRIARNDYRQRVIKEEAEERRAKQAVKGGIKGSKKSKKTKAKKAAKPATEQVPA